MNRPYQSIIYGLRVAAPFALPGPAFEGPSDVFIREGTCSESLSDEDIVTAHMQINPNACLTQVREMGRVLVKRDGQIVLDCPPELPEAWKVTLALGSGLGTYLHMIGRIPLHGMAWVANGSATLVLGRSGTGKSTLAAAMLYCGHKLLSDDVVPVSLDQSNNPIAYPAHRRFKLSPALLGALGIDAGLLPNVLPGSDKMAWAIPADAFHSEPTPISRCIILSPKRSGTAQISLQPLIGLNALQRLKRQVYRPKLVSAFAKQNQLFTLAHQLGTKSTVEICQLPDLNTFQTFRHYAFTLDEGFAP